MCVYQGTVLSFYTRHLKYTKTYSSFHSLYNFHCFPEKYSCLFLTIKYMNILYNKSLLFYYVYPLDFTFIYIAPSHKNNEIAFRTYSFKMIYFTFILCIWVFSHHVICAPPHVCSAHWGQKQVLSLL